MSRRDWRLVGAFGFLWFDIAVLGRVLRRGRARPAAGRAVLAYQIGYLSNLLPIPGSIGILDGSFVGMFVLYGVSATLATAATVVYHAIALWVPAMWGTIAFLILRRSRGEPLKLRPPREERKLLREERRTDPRRTPRPRASRSSPERSRRACLWDTGPIGAWRSLVARTVRVGEVRGSNPRAPIFLSPRHPAAGRAQHRLRLVRRTGRARDCAGPVRPGRPRPGPRRTSRMSPRRNAEGWAGLAGEEVALLAAPLEAPLPFREDAGTGGSAAGGPPAAASGEPLVTAPRPGRTAPTGAGTAGGPDGLPAAPLGAVAPALTV